MDKQLKDQAERLRDGARTDPEFGEKYGLKRWAESLESNTAESRLHQYREFLSRHQQILDALNECWEIENCNERRATIRRTKLRRLLENGSLALDEVEEALAAGDAEAAFTGGLQVHYAFELFDEAFTAKYRQQKPSVAWDRGLIVKAYREAVKHYQGKFAVKERVRQTEKVLTRFLGCTHVYPDETESNRGPQKILFPSGTQMNFSSLEKRIGEYNLRAVERWNLRLKKRKQG